MGFINTIWRFRTCDRFSIATTFLVLAYLPNAVRVDAADEKSWELSNYRVRITIALDTSARPLGISSEKLANELIRRLRAYVAPLWSASVGTADDGFRTLLLRRLETLQAEDLPERQRPLDKELLLAGTSTLTGIELSCREYDLFTQRWSETLNSTVRQDRLLPEAAFSLICDTFSPLAVVRADLEDESHVTLLFKGAQLPRQGEAEMFVRPGDVFQPLLVRLSRTAGDPPETIVDLPWTYLTASGRVEDDWDAAVLTGTRSPFGTRRRGRIETMALEVKHPASRSEARFYATHDKAEGLSGYEVFCQDPGKPDFVSLGFTDLDGRVVVPQGESPVRMLLLRSDGQLLAKVPVVAGKSGLQEIPIADDVARLLAQEELIVLKEKLIDVVARRNILMARIRSLLGTKNQKAIDDMLDELNDLPDRARFDRMFVDSLNTYSAKAGNPRIQQKIERMYSDARTLLGQFLGVSDITNIEAEVRESRKQKSDASAESDNVEQGT